MIVHLQQTNYRASGEVCQNFGASEALFVYMQNTISPCLHHFCLCSHQINANCCHHTRVNT